MTRKRITARPRRIPRSKRLLESARRLIKGLRQDLTGRKVKTKTGERNPWPRCQGCLRRVPELEPGCVMCAGCCPGHERDDDEDDTGGHHPDRDA